MPSQCFACLRESGVLDIDPELRKLPFPRMRREVDSAETATSEPSDKPAIKRLALEIVFAAAIANVFEHIIPSLETSKRSSIPDFRVGSRAGPVRRLVSADRDVLRMHFIRLKVSRTELLVLNVCAEGGRCGNQSSFDKPGTPIVVRKPHGGRPILERSPSSDDRRGTPMVVRDDRRGTPMVVRTALELIEQRQGGRAVRRVPRAGAGRTRRTTGGTGRRVVQLTDMAHQSHSSR